MTTEQFEIILAKLLSLEIKVDTLTAEATRSFERRVGRPPLPTARRKARVWDYVNENPGCTKTELRRLITAFTNTQFLELVEALAIDGKEIYPIRGPKIPGRQNVMQWYTREQLMARKKWPITEEMKVKNAIYER